MLKFNPKRNTNFSFYCQNCGKYTEKLFYRLNVKRFLLCTKCLRKYSNSLKTEEEKKLILRKHEESCLKHFGTKYPIQNTQIKEKIKQTCLSKYGFDNPAKSKDVEEKREQTCIQKYGRLTYLTTKQGKEKTKNTNLKKYKTVNSNQSDLVKQKKKQTFLEKYDADNPLKSEKIKEKIKQTNLEKYGVENYSQSEEARKHRHNVYTFNNQSFDSKAELCFYIYCKDQNLPIQKCSKRFEYFVDNQIHYYFPDFEINKQIYEIKGSQFLKEDNT